MHKCIRKYFYANLKALEPVISTDEHTTTWSNAFAP